MIWLTWRQFRTQATVVVGVLLVISTPAVVTGLQVRHWVAACATSGSCVGGSTAALTYMAQFGWVKVLIGGGLLVLPAVTGMFFAAPLVARELDTGTFRLVWTQSVSRRRWLTVKVAVVGTTAVLASGLLSWLTTWWFEPADAVNHQKFVDSTFGIRDVAPLGYAAFAFGVGLAAGLLIGKVLPAMATTLGVFVVARLVVQMFVRAHFAAPLARTVPLADTSQVSDITGKPATPLPPGSWVVTQQVLDTSGHPISHPLLVGPGAPCAGTGSCLHGYTLRLVYQPGSRYWPFQWTEFGIFTLLGLLLIAFSYWWLTGHRLPGRTSRPVRSSTPALLAHPRPGMAAANRERPAAGRDDGSSSASAKPGGATTRT